MILDLNMWKNQIFYDPFTFGQYTDSKGYIYTVSNATFVANANKTTLSHDWRWNNTIPGSNKTYGEEDMRMNSKYLNFSLGLKGLAFVPSIVAFIVFGLLVWFYGREDAVTVVEDCDKVDGIVVDQWQCEEKPSDPGMICCPPMRTLYNKQGSFWLFIDWETLLYLRSELDVQLAPFQ